MTELSDLARPFPKKFIHDNPTGYGSYVAHHIVNQRLLQVLGPFDYEVVQVIRGPVPADKQPGLPDAIVGVVARLTVTIDGRLVRVEEAGDCERPTNWPHDGARLKDAMSDALKRCAMRLGLGLHLWSQGDYYLYDRLTENEDPQLDDLKLLPRDVMAAGGSDD